MKLSTLLLSFSLSTLALARHVSEEFSEDLTLRSLPDGKLLAHFEFVTHVEADTPSGAPLLDYNLFPKAIGQVLQEYDVREMHLTFAQGRWNYDEWGYPMEQSTGTGVELWAWIRDRPNSSIQSRWKSLTNTLSGLFCASLNFIDETLTTEPVLSFRLDEPLDLIPLDKANTTLNEDSHLRYGYLPQENVCTENLTPWIKLLPCKAKSGIATLLNAHKIYNSNFHSMSIHAKSLCTDERCSRRKLELRQSVTSVLDTVKDTSRRDWALDDVFDRILRGACPLADHSRVHVIQDQVTGDLASLSPAPTNLITKETSKSALYDLHQFTGDLNIRMTWPEDFFEYPFAPANPMISAHRYFTGYGQERGGLRITIHNRGDISIPLIYYDALPWYLKVYLHTLQVDVLDTRTSEHLSSDVIEQMFYEPARDRERSTMLECQMVLAPHSIVTVSLEFDKVFLRYTEHRPDANRGFDVGPAVLTAQIPEHSLHRTIRVYTDTLLVSLPTPDFSMPYNVITLTCTVIALCFGSIFNLLTRSFQMVEPVKEDGEEVAQAGDATEK
ncbi:GPI transamidase component PIG-T [Syncephalastrum racemosum]|uniref:GPI transamidase component PIG-T n=1 Tax=Syncephalastrum racemosum TaxID=13706 RepID=A0A1X2H4Y1_SYNRA|nr:GPI transamidase component PIG-T [Syncephalastrum racemosum]